MHETPPPVRSPPLTVPAAIPPRVESWQDFLSVVARSSRTRLLCRAVRRGLLPWASPPRGPPPRPRADRPASCSQKLSDSPPGRGGAWPSASVASRVIAFAHRIRPVPAQVSSPAEVWPLLGAAVRFGPVPGRPSLEVRFGAAFRRGGREGEEGGRAQGMEKKESLPLPA